MLGDKTTKTCAPKNDQMPHFCLNVNHLHGGGIKVLLLANRSMGQLECGRLALTSISSKDMSLISQAGSSH